MNVKRGIEITTPYLIFMGDIKEEVEAKTGFGLVQWRRSLCIGQWRLEGATVDLGLPEMSPSEAAARGARSLVLGVATVGGVIPAAWAEALNDGARSGLDIVAGLHSRLASVPGLSATAEAAGVRLIDVRVPPPGLPVGTGKKRSGLRLLTVGTDCAVGKKYTALAIEREMHDRGMRATFRATGQTGIMIAGSGIPIDAVVADFLSGAAEVLTPDNDADHWDIIEGQGALLHPGYGAVTLGLLLGSQPDAIVLCHDSTRTTAHGWPDYPLPDLAVAIEGYVSAGRLTNPAVRCAGVSVNTSKLSSGRRAYLDGLSSRLRLPCMDPLIDGVAAIVDQLTASGKATPITGGAAWEAEASRV